MAGLTSRRAAVRFAATVLVVLRGVAFFEALLRLTLVLGAVAFFVALASFGFLVRVAEASLGFADLFFAMFDRVCSDHPLIPCHGASDPFRLLLASDLCELRHACQHGPTPASDPSACFPSVTSRCVR